MNRAKTIYRWLLPTAHNQYRPPLLRWPVVALLLLGLGIAQLAYNLGETSRAQVFAVSSQLEAEQITILSNQERVQAGLPALRTSAALERAAEAKAADMLARDYWNHFAPDGTAPWQFLNQQNYLYQVAGENLARDFDTEAGVVSGWMNSPSHRDNLLDSRFSEIGVAAARGEFNDRESTIVVAFYAQPLQTPTLSGPVIKPGVLGQQTMANFKAPNFQVNFSLARPLPALITMPWWAKLASATLLALLVLYTLQHLLVQRRGQPTSNHHRLTLLRLSLLMLGVLALVLASYGAVM
jgi:hypothetical protein